MNIFGPGSEGNDSVNESEALAVFRKRLKVVPRLARVGFAVRCAQRVKPLIAYYWPTVPVEVKEAVSTAVTLSERLAGRSYLTAGEVELADRVADACMSVKPKTNSASAGAALRAVASAARAAGAAAAGDHARSIELASTCAAFAARSAFAIIEIVAVYRAIQRDLSLLNAASEAENWTDDTPVPPEFFGPLWPHGVPEGWPKHLTDAETPARPNVLLLEFTIPPGVYRDDADEAIQQIILALNHLHHALGGNGIRIADDVHAYEPAPVLEPEPEPAGGPT